MNCIGHGSLGPSIFFSLCPSCSLSLSPPSLSLALDLLLYSLIVVARAITIAYVLIGWRLVGNSISIKTRSIIRFHSLKLNDDFCTRLHFKYNFSLVKVAIRVGFSFGLSTSFFSLFVAYLCDAMNLWRLMPRLLPFSMCERVNVAQMNSVWLCVSLLICVVSRLIHNPFCLNTIWASLYYFSLICPLKFVRVSILLNGKIIPTTFNYEAYACACICARHQHLCHTHTHAYAWFRC